MSLGASFVARSFSGDKEQLVPILKAAVAHRGFAFVDVISPCVTFNDHEGSTKAYAYTRQHDLPIVETDFVPLRTEIVVPPGNDAMQTVTLHDGSQVRLRRLRDDYDPTDRDAALAYLRARRSAGEIATGLLFVSAESKDVHDLNRTVPRPLASLPHEELCPGAAKLADIMKTFR